MARTKNRCFPAWCSVRIVEANCTLPPAKVLTAHKTITAVQDIKAIQEIVRHTSSEKKSCGKSFSTGYLP